MKQDAAARKKLRCLLPIFASVSCLCSLGCGAPAAPLPPTLNLPQPVHDLAAGRVGDTVHLTYTVPEKTTDKLPVRGAMVAHLCRSVENGPCQLTETGAIALAAKRASLDDPLPPELSQGAPRLLTYTLSILNRAGKSAGDSAPAYAVAGAAPPPVAGLAATPRRKGIVLSWQSVSTSEGMSEWVRFDRTRTSAPAAQQDAAASGNPFPGSKAKEEPAEQVLRVPEPAPGESGFALDTTARTGNSYRYTAQRVADVTLGRRALQLVSPPSASAATDYRDVFPPPVPVGLVSASDASGKAIDLDWTPDVDPGLAGYIVYRRAAGSAETPQRISSGKPVALSSYSDTTAAPGQRYAYSVSAIDLSGNESARSQEIEDEWNSTGAASEPAAHPTHP